MEIRYLAYALALLMVLAFALIVTMLRGRWKANNAARLHEDTEQADMAEARRELLRHSLDS